ncbi:glycosyltransferase family protein [Paenibacillus kobensis]|uniref:glycosyltransferase family 4 protein n=1 Tax=Paenibacillus kobensis TaxID=59841 RepID=UPI000FDC26A5|nr:glycosyltransferase family 4 protein [Paenibacillus kobensis]
MGSCGGADEATADGAMSARRSRSSRRQSRRGGAQNRSARRKPARLKRRSAGRSGRRRNAGGGGSTAPTVVTVPPPSPVYEGLPGVQLVGFSRSDSGIGEACRLQASSLLAAGVPTSIISCDALSLNRPSDESCVPLEHNEPFHKCTVLQFNPDMLPHVLGKYGHRPVERKFTVGYWHWELMDIPEEWTASMHYFHEIWTPSQFVRDAVAARSPVPVLTMPYGCAPDDRFRPGRAYYGLPADRYLFMMMFDTHSFMERKNPLGALEAFLLAFGGSDPSVGLVLKANNANHGGAALAHLRQRMAGCSNVYFIEAGMTRQETGGLIGECDAYVSLHRAEGFGLGIAEAMVRNKPAIATNWSGSTDFLNSSNGCPVGFRLVPIAETLGPYRAGSLWAEPDLAQAAYYMRLLACDRQTGIRLGAAAAQTINTRYNPAIAGAAMRQRLAQIGLV